MREGEVVRDGVETERLGLEEQMCAETGDGERTGREGGERKQKLPRFGGRSLHQHFRVMHSGRGAGRLPKATEIMKRNIILHVMKEKMFRLWKVEEFSPLAATVNIIMLTVAHVCLPGSAPLTPLYPITAPRSTPIKHSYSTGERLEPESSCRGQWAQHQLSP